MSDSQQPNPSDLSSQTAADEDLQPREDQAADLAGGKRVMSRPRPSGPLRA